MFLWDWEHLQASYIVIESEIEDSPVKISVGWSRGRQSVVNCVYN